MRARRRTVLLMVALLFGQLLATASPASAAGPEVQRLAGANRFATAAAVSRASYPTTPPAVFIATGANYADALAISASAAGVGPVLLVERDRLPSETAAELRRLAPETIVVVGGPVAVSSATEIAVARYSRGQTLRIDGPDRFGTAAEISRLAHADGADVAFVATGHAFQDALGATASAAAFDAPLLLTAPTTLPAATEQELRRLGPSRIVVVGSTADVSDAVVQRLRTLASDEVVRIDGADDAATSAAVSRATFSSSISAFLATSGAFPDGLTGGAFAGAVPAPLMLISPDRVPDAVKCELVRLGVDEIVVLGGPAAVSDRVAAELRQGYAAGDIPGCRAPMFEAVAGAPLRGMTIDPTSTYAYVTNPTRNVMQVVELRTAQVVAEAATGSEPADVDLSPDGDTLYVSNNGGQDIWRYDVTDPEAPARVGRVRIDSDPLNERRAWTLEVLSNGRALIAPTVFDATEGDCLEVIDLTTGSRTPITIVNERTGEVTDGECRIETPDDTSGDDTSGGDTSGGDTSGGDTGDTTDGTDGGSDGDGASDGTVGIVRMVSNADASKVALSIGSDLYTYDAGATTARGGYNGGTSIVDLAFSRDGRRILVDDGAGVTFVLNAALQLEGTIRGDGPTAGVALSADGSTGYRVDLDTGIELLSTGRFLPTGELLALADEPLAAPGDSTVTLSPNGRYLVMLTQNGVQVTVL